MLRCQCPSVCPSVHLSVMEVHWHIIANLGFKFRSQFTMHCGHGACGCKGRDHRWEEWRAHLVLCLPLQGLLVFFVYSCILCMCMLLCLCRQSVKQRYIYYLLFTSTKISGIIFQNFSMSSNEIIWDNKITSNKTAITAGQWYIIYEWINKQWLRVPDAFKAQPGAEFMSCTPCSCDVNDIYTLH